MTRYSRGPASEVARYFLRLGVIAFGGPAAHIAIMRRELVQARGWTTDQELVDMLGVTNLIPGPNSTELAMHMGAVRAGWRGLWIAGLCFILPAIWGLKGAMLKGVETFALVFVVAFASAAGAGEVVLIFGAGFAMLFLHTLVRLLTGNARRNLDDLPSNGRRGRWRGPFTRRWALAPLTLAAHPPGYSPWELLLVFLKIGSLLYGSGYVLLAFMQTEFVDHRAWLTQTQLVDAISAGQFTPGPVFSTAAFAGYVIDGWRGGIIAAAGIFLPSFVFVTLTHPVVPRLRRSTRAAPFLDGVNAAALALMVVVTVRLGLEVLDGWYSALLFVAGITALLRFNPNSAWLVLAGLAAGLAYTAVT
jgi:chromate transporter